MSDRKFVAIDLGASEIRGVSNNGHRFTLPHSGSFLPAPTALSFRMPNDVAEYEITIEGLNDAPMTILFGEPASRYGAPLKRPSMLEPKHKQDICVAGIVFAVACSRIAQSTPNSKVDLFLALPQGEITKARKDLPEVLCKSLSVRFNRLDKETKFTIEHLYIYEEGRLAGQAYIDGADDQAVVLSVDIGATTTDLALFKNGQPVEKTTRTFKVGGNTAREFLISSILEEYDFEVPSDDAEEVVRTGVLRIGSGMRDVTELVNTAKERLASELITQFQSYFRTVNTPLQSVSTIVLSGGGALKQKGAIDAEPVAGAKKTSKTPAVTENKSRSVASYIMAELNRIVELNVVEYDGDVRMANLDGLHSIAQRVFTGEEIAY